MEHWALVKLACGVPDTRVADPRHNAAEVIALAEAAARAAADLICFPELTLSACTCGDLFAQSTLSAACGEALLRVARASAAWPRLMLLVGAPFAYRSRLYNCAFLIRAGHILACIPKSLPAAHGAEARHFSAAPAPRSELSHSVATAQLGDQSFPFGQCLIQCALRESEPQAENAGAAGAPASPYPFYLGVELGSDLDAVQPPSSALALAGADIVVNLAAEPERAGGRRARIARISAQSARLNCAYLYCSAGAGESSGDQVYGGHCLVCEDGRLLAEKGPFGAAGEVMTTVVDVAALRHRRLLNPAFARHPAAAYPQLNLTEPFAADPRARLDARPVEALPFVPADPAARAELCEEVLDIQARGLGKRLRATGIERVVLGVSGGLDSTLALLVCVRAFEILGRPLSDIHALTLPGFGTSERTYQNARRLMESYGLSTEEISIVPAVLQHFADIGQDPERHDLTYENSQARERTQILMDYGNHIGALVVGTGDLSELALGWCTYNGDHMSMYGVNASVPKTLIRHLIAQQAERMERAGTAREQGRAAILRDILDTPISPELLPPDAQGKIRQYTEDSTGPYVLHDFFLYHSQRYGYGPAKLFYLARRAFAAGAARGEAPAFSEAELLRYLDLFFRRFFSQQFKRSCLPDGPQVGALSLSPRGGWQMPSDAERAAWAEAIEALRARTDSAEQ